MNEKKFIAFWNQDSTTDDMKQVLMLEFINNNIDQDHFLGRQTKKFLRSEIIKRNKLIGLVPA
jgi:hypothetical protein